eukprot:TRINITY_DN3270_c0_g1_i2.p1 TRINITY_DN3270_c0_g1~~TRINITY_DN3270_c0_g1_i2.p1  ORF type:complete len:175 (-),score=29.27 TRINITY_DN3270_c0_g1_i2:173-697(-)
MSERGSIFDRLSDPSSFTGTHKERFDTDGRGRGLAGRMDVVQYSGSTCSSTRDPHIYSTARPERRKPVVTVPLGKVKFGVQVTKPPIILVFRNGDKHHEGEYMAIKAHYKNIQQVMDDMTKTVKLYTGAVKKIYAQDRVTVVRSVEDFEDGGKYLCCGGEAPASYDHLPLAFLM